ncbi:hypothetical protein BDQ12DRAFT_677063 [Crucibulum laeve]|uniref:Uncharacterized protein n=1 Tax=Crucibulum laeve TaxID=68775 RepID=A0A5C3MGC5_9AGAR|nr:hypothetical protein BDQ12DRAFT_677063 [Crucibulum laeve]
MQMANSPITFPFFLPSRLALPPSPTIDAFYLLPASRTPSMVHLVLSSAKGNQGLRYFPHSGYLGLTPVRIEGLVKTKFDADQKPLHAKCLTISVRCYESRVGRVNVLQSNVLVDYTQVLWSKPDGVESEQIGNMEYPFRLSIPAKVAGFSTAVFVDYRCIWRVEAILTHVPIAGVGSRQIKHFELPLIRYDLPPPLPSSRVPEPPLNQITNKHRAPRIRYSINSPTAPVGPLDLVPIPIHLLPVDQGVSIRSASVIVERRIQLNDAVNSFSSSPASPISPQSSPKLHEKASLSQSTPDVPSALSSQFSYSPTHSYQEPHYSSDPLASTSSLSSSNPTITPGTVYPSSASVASETQPLLSHQSSAPAVLASPHQASKVIVNPVAGAESSGQFSRDPKGVWSKTLTLQWPAAKSHSRWAIGETIQSDLVSVKFFIKVKIVVSSPSGTESIELADKELCVVSTNDSERQLAISKYNELSDLLESSGRSKSKSPRRSRIGRDDNVPPSPAPYPTKNKSSTRRPHTSAGPRDKPSGFGTSYGRSREPEREAGTSSLGDREPASYRKRRIEGSSTRTRPDTSQSEAKHTNGKPSLTFFSSSSSSAYSSPRMGNAPSGSSTSTTASSSSISSSSQGGESESDQHMREWEEELARIEMRSRRSSDLLGFAGKRKRSAGAPRVVQPGDEEIS